MDTVETHVLEGGQYVARRVSAMDILKRERERREREQQRDPVSHPEYPTSIGLLSTTLVHSPVVTQILPGRIRGTTFNDLLFVAEDYVHVVEIQTDGRLRYVGTKSDFGSRIRAAAIVGKCLEEHDDDFLSSIKRESPDDSPDDGQSNFLPLPPQMLVVSLASGELIFLFAQFDGTSDSLRFFQSRAQLPLGRLPLLQVGRHLTVDPLSRAIAVSSTGGGIFVYKLRTRDQLEQEANNQDPSWNYVAGFISIDARGIILQMAFLTPRPDDTHSAILAIVVNDKRGECRIRCYEIDLTEPMGNFTQLVNHPIEDDFRTTTHLIPTSYYPNFLLVSGNKVIQWTDVLTGSPHQVMVSHEQPVEDDSYPEPKYPASSSRLPIYTAWVRAERHHPRWKERSNEVFYLVREDGIIHQLMSHRGFSFTLSKAGKFACTGSAAFTSFLASDKFKDPDYLIVAGQGSSGQVISIGPSTRQSGEFKPRDHVMAPAHVEWIPNWAPVGDIAVICNEAGTTELSSHVPTSLSSIYMTSGTQPYGAISELRIGLEARTSISMELMEESEMAAFTDIWPLPLETDRGPDAMFFFSAPSETLVVRYNGNDEVQAAEGDIETQQETLLTAQLDSKHILHITSRSIIAYSIQDGEEGLCLFRLVERLVDGSILKASYLEAESGLLIGIQRGDSCCLQLQVITMVNDDVQIDLYSNEIDMKSYPTAIKLFHDVDGFGALIADGRGKLGLYGIPQAPEEPIFIQELAIPKNDDEDDFIPLAESIAILASANSDCGPPRILVVVGLRDGRLWKIGRSSLSSEVAQSLLCGELAEILNPSANATDFTAIGFEPVRILYHNRSTSSMVVLFCGPDVCRLKYSGEGINDLLIDSIWFTDQSQPQFAPRPFYAMALHQSSNFKRTTLFGTTGSSLLVAELDTQRKPLPRRMLLEDTDDATGLKEDNLNSTGSPRDLLHLKHLNLLVVATTVWELQRHARIPQPSWRGKRSVRGAIKLMQLDNSTACIAQEAFKLLPSERITGMDEWDELRKDKDDTSAYIVIGTRHVSKTTEPRGRIFVVKVWLDGDLVPCLKILKMHSFDNAPITAVTALGKTASGSSLALDSSSTKAFKGDYDIDEQSDRGDGPSKGPAVNGNSRLVVGLNKGSEKRLDIYELQMRLGVQNETHLTPESPEAVSQPKLRRISSAVLPSSAVRITGPAEGRVSISTVEDSWQSYTFDGSQSLKLIKSDEMVREGLDHLDLTFDNEDLGYPFSMVLISDREGHVAGLQTSPLERSIKLGCRTLFTATMPQAIVRVKSGNIRPLWRRRLPQGVRANNIVGVATDGSFYGFSILDEHALLMLQYLQNLVLYHGQGQRWIAGQYYGDPVTIDPEFTKKKHPVGTPTNHINGDTLMCLIEPNGGHLLQEMLESRHWEDNHMAAHVGNEVEVRTAKFGQLVNRLWNEREFKGVEDRVDSIIGWLREVLSPIL